MKLNELKTKKIAKDMPMGKNEVIFNRIDYRTDRDTGDINGVFIHVQEFRPLFLPFFDNGDNFQLDLLLGQLGCDSYDPDEINKCSGTVIIAHRYTREANGRIYTNVSFNPSYSQVNNSNELPI